MAHLTVKIALAEKGMIGPGKVQLLELIQKHGSIRAAAAAMNMSYRRAWLLIKEAEDIMGAPVIRAETGGAKGGGAILSEVGHAIIDRYRSIEKRAAKSAEVVNRRSVNRRRS